MDVKIKDKRKKIKNLCPDTCALLSALRPQQIVPDVLPAGTGIPAKVTISGIHFTDDFFGQISGFNIHLAEIGVIRLRNETGQCHALFDHFRYL